MSDPKLNTIQKWMLVIGALCLGASIFLPIWRIELDAPQYPEGLNLLIYPYKLGGQVDIVNGLNHYIGMKTMHKEDFIEFTVLPYIIGFFALWSVLVAFIGKRKWLSILLITFILFGIIAMVDFWKWEYNYGHNLDPNAAIIVPGMSYQPPLIGFKQLLNFGAYSIPDIGGWLFIIAGLTMVFAWFLSRKKMNLRSVAMLVFVWTWFQSCQQNSPQPIQYNVDVCASCQMTIVDQRFGCELITKKGRIIKFDDVVCMQTYAEDMGLNLVATYYCSSFSESNDLINIDSLQFVQSDQIKSPMNGQMAAFVEKEAAIRFRDSVKGSLVSLSISSK